MDLASASIREKRSTRAVSKLASVSGWPNVEVLGSGPPSGAMMNARRSVTSAGNSSGWMVSLALMMRQASPAPVSMVVGVIAVNLRTSASVRHFQGCVTRWRS